jgi:iron complex transport system substrate-binding protein
MRIVSLVPSLTKTVCDFGLSEQIVGITNFCVDPPGLWRTSHRVGGTKDPDLQVITDLKPTHVIVNTEENRPQDIEILARDFNVLTTFPKSPDDVPELLLSMGDFLGCKAIAVEQAEICENLLTRIAQESLFHNFIGQRFIYLIWKDPWMAAGPDTYISRFLERVGLRNIICANERYPVIEPAASLGQSLDVILMSSEPWPFRKRDAQVFSCLLGEKLKPIYWIDGKATSWYGTETIAALQSWLGNSPQIRPLI